MSAEGLKRSKLPNMSPAKHGWGVNSHGRGSVPITGRFARFSAVTCFDQRHMAIIP